MKTFISGASGLVGGNCLKYFKEQGVEVIGSHRSFPTTDTVFFDSLENDRVKNFDLKKSHPAAIIHCGALTHVDYCETHEEESFRMNVTALERLLDICENSDAAFVFLSTDYVFDGKEGPYREEASVRPLNIYGKHKLFAEELIQKRLKNYLILRVTNVYGDEIRNKNFISRITQQCKQGQSISLKLPVDQFATPTNARDIARAIYLLLKNNKTGIYHISGTDYMNRVSLARKVLSYFPEISFEIEKHTTKDLMQAATRPLYGGLISAKFLTEFPDFLFDSVDNYLSRMTGVTPKQEG